MKKILSAIALCLFFGASALAQDAKIIIRGQIADTLLLNVYDAPVVGAKKFVQYITDAHERSENVIEIPDSLCHKRLYLSYNKHFTFLELKSGQVLTVNVDDAQLSFSGDDSRVNEYLYEWTNRFVDASPHAFAYRMRIRNFFASKTVARPSELENEEQIKAIEGLSKQAMKHFQSFKFTDEAFVAQQTVWIKYLEARILLENYRYMKLHKMVFDENYKDAFSKISFNDIDVLNHPDATEMMSYFFQMQEEVLGVERLLPHTLAGRASELKHDELKEKYILDELGKMILAQKAFLLDETFAHALPLVKSPEGKAKMAEMKPKVDALIKIEMRGQDAFEFAFQDNHGKLVKMSDFRGKYVFIDMWATWCAPCNINIPYLNMLEEELKDENIAFVSISIDRPETKQKWLDFLAKTHIGGTALLAKNAFKDEMCQYYGIRAIPRFMLIDPEGKIVSAHCLQPMDAGFRKYMVEFMKTH
ncbi:MAG: TlpA family protein disulfide reductase [Mangrovibacterium sp.]